MRGNAPRTSINANTSLISIERSDQRIRPNKCLSKKCITRAIQNLERAKHSDSTGEAEQGQRSWGGMSEANGGLGVLLNILYTFNTF